MSRRFRMYEKRTNFSTTQILFFRYGEALDGTVMHLPYNPHYKNLSSYSQLLIFYLSLCGLSIFARLKRLQTPQARPKLHHQVDTFDRISMHVRYRLHYQNLFLFSYSSRPTHNLQTFNQRITLLNPKFRSYLTTQLHRKCILLKKYSGFSTNLSTIRTHFTQMRNVGKNVAGVWMLQAE